MSGDNTPTPQPIGHPSLPLPSTQSDIESSPIYQALSSRISRTENTLSSIQSQINQLSSIVKSIQQQQITTSPTKAKTTSGIANKLTTPSSASVFAPFDSELPPLTGNGFPTQNGLPKSPFIPTSTTTPQAQSQLNANSGNTDIAALTQQISALSTSVAQLQRLQQQQSQLTRQSSSNSNQTPTLSSISTENNHGGNTHNNSNRHPGPLVLGIPNRPLHQGVESLINSSGPMTTPTNPVSSLHSQSPGPNSGIPSGSAFGSIGGGNRPGINRSFSSGIIGQPSISSLASGQITPGNEFSATTSSRLNHQAHTPSGLRERDWPNTSSPGPGQGQGQNNSERNNNTLSVGGPLTPGGSGVAAPGAGIVITKWEHLNLKVDLLRSISKYGIGPPNKIQTRVLPFMIKGSDIIAQAPPTTERIISYVIPALHLVQNLPPPPATYGGPGVIIITTTVDQAMQCHKLVRGVGGPLGIRSAVAAGAAGSSSLPNEIAAMQRDAIHVLIGTPAKVAEVMTSRGGLGGGECRLLILDEVDQMIARNLYDNVLNIAKLLPAPRRGGAGGASMTGPLTPGGAMTPFSPGLVSPYDAGRDSPFNPASKTPFPTTASRFGNPAGMGSSAVGGPTSTTVGAQAGAGNVNGIERQTCLFSNTIPTDVINFSQSLSVRDPVRVLVRREGGTNSQESVSSVTPGINLKHTYVYLTITGSAQSGNNNNHHSQQQTNESGPGTIGSGRNLNQSGQGGQGHGQNEEQNRAKEYKLDMLIKMLEDYPLWQAIVHVGSYSMLEAVVFRLQSRKWETLYMTPDMPPTQKKAILQQWRISLSGNGPRFLVCFDVNIKPPEVPWSPLVINFDLPRSVEGYAHRAAAAVPPTNPRQGQGQGGQGQQQQQVNGVIVSFVQAAGGDVEMLRSTECAYRFKSAEIPTVFHDLFNH